MSPKVEEKNSPHSGTLQGIDPLFDLLFQDSGLGVLITDQDYRILDCNQPVEQLLLQTKDRINGKNILDLIGGSDRIFLGRMLDQLKSGKKQSIQIEKEIKFSDALEPLCRVRMTFKILGGTPPRIIFLLQNVSDYHEIVRKQQHAESNLQDSLEILADAHMIFDSQDRLLSCTSRMSELFPEVRHMLRPGVDIGEICSKIVYSGSITDAIGNESAYLEELQHNQKLGNFRHFFKHKNKKYYLLQKAILEQGSIYAFTNVTSHMEKDSLLATLASENTQLSEAIQSTNTGIVICDARLPGYPIIFVNRAFASMTEYAADRIIGYSLNFFYGANTSAESIDAIQKCFSQGRPVEVELQIYRHNQSHFWAQLQINPVTDANGQISHFVIIQTDITQRKVQEFQLREAKNMADEASKVKSQFLAIMSHEMKTPINGVMGMIGLLQDTNINAEQREFLETARASSENLLELVDNILDYSEIDSNQLKIKRKAVNLSEIIQKYALTFRNEAIAKNIDLNLHLASDLPKTLYGDSERIGQILKILIGNAIKFTARGNVDVFIRTQPQGNDATQIELKVRDSGIGMPLEMQSVIFQPFQQADFTLKRKFNGAGLGLAICKKLTLLMGGDIAVQSRPGAGSTFTCWFTLSNNDGSPSNPAESVSPSPTHAKKILIVDDSATNRMVPINILKNLGLNLTGAEHGEAALQLCAQEKFDLILMDLSMPVMDGITAAHKIKALNDHYKNIPIIAMTSSSLPGEKQRCVDAGMIDYMLKPIHKAQLLDCVLKHIELHDQSLTKDAEAMLDQSILRQLEEDIGHDTLMTLLDTFIEETVTRLDSIQRLAQQEKWEALSKEGHTLKSTAGSFGLMPLHIKAKLMDESCRQHNHDQARQYASEIAIMGKESLDKLQDWIKVQRA